MAPLPEGLSQLLGVRLITLEHFHDGRGSKLFLLELTLALDRDLSSLPSVLLLKLPSVALQNGSTTMVFTGNEIQPWAHALGVPWSYHIPHHHEATALTGD